MRPAVSAIVISLLLMTGSSVFAADELAAFVPVHREVQKLADAKKWADAAKAYGAFATAHPNDPAAPLASIFQGIILRRELGRRSDAAVAFALAAKAPATQLGNALGTVARTWLARMQMEPIDAALRSHYVDKVEYPVSLDELVAKKLVQPAQLIDPWADRFEYKPKAHRLIRGMPRQAYDLRTKHAAGTSRELKQILKDSAAFERAYIYKAATSTKPIKAILARSSAPNNPLPPVTEGSKLGSATVVRVTRNAVLLISREFAAVCLR